MLVIDMMHCSFSFFPFLSHVEQELLTLSDHMSSPPVFVGVCDA
jgi:hypothetical protein